MAHNLNFNETTGDYSFFSVKEKAWHGLGIVVDQYPTSAEAIAFAGLDYQVEKMKLLASLPEIKEGQPEATVPVGGYFATMRTDTKAVLGVVENSVKLTTSIRFKLTTCSGRN